MYIMYFHTFQLTVTHPQKKLMPDLTVVCLSIFFSPIQSSTPNTIQGIRYHYVTPSMRKRARRCLSSSTSSDNLSETTSPSEGNDTDSSQNESSSSSVDPDICENVRLLRSTPAFQDLPELSKEEVVDYVTKLRVSPFFDAVSPPSKRKFLRLLCTSFTLVPVWLTTFEQFEELIKHAKRRKCFRTLPLRDKEQFLLQLRMCSLTVSSQDLLAILNELVASFTLGINISDSCSFCSQSILNIPAVTCKICSQVQHTHHNQQDDGSTCSTCKICYVCHRSTITSHSVRCFKCNVTVHARCLPGCHRCVSCNTPHTSPDCRICDSCLLQRKCSACATQILTGVFFCKCRRPFCSSCYNQSSCDVCRAIPKSNRTLPNCSLGPLGACPYCSARVFTNHKTTFCCSAGKHVLGDEDRFIPTCIADFFSRHVELLAKSSREVNQLASLTAVGVHSSSGHRGGVQFDYNDRFAMLHGRLYHFDMFDNGNRQHPLLGDARSYLFAESTPVTFTDRFNPAVVSAAVELRSILRENNTLIHHLQQNLGTSTLDFLQFLSSATHMYCHLDNAQVSDTSQNQLMLLFNLNGSQFSAPSTNQVVVGNGLTRISFSDAKYEQTAYPLLDPYSCTGWFQRYEDGIRHRHVDLTGNQLTIRKYLRFKFSQCQSLLWLPTLTQEWLLDMVCRSEYQNQTFLLSIMTNIAAASSVSARRVAKAHTITLAHSPTQTGRRCDIPSSVRGSPQYRRLKVDTGMCHIYRFGSPTLFITVTANPFWEEIQSNLLPGQQWHHDVYLVNLVFQLKLKLLISQIESGVFFNGRRAVFVQYVIEFQKRGLPHAHILVRLEGLQPTTPDEINELCQAIQPQLCETHCGFCSKCKLAYCVRKHMWHRCFPGRCYHQSSESKTCKYGFPFQAEATSFVGEDGFWILRRGLQDDRVVEYNPELLLAFNCHINVKIACGTRCVLYLRKYLSKGPDSVAAFLLPEGTSFNKQLNHFYETRSMTAAEAGWVACEFPFNYFNPPVLILKLYLPGEHPIYFDERDTDEEVLGKALKLTHLETYFSRPAGAPFDEMTFEEYFTHYNVSTKGNPSPRASPIVAVIRNIDFANSEQFSLYMLVKNRSARSFDQLLNGYPTFEKSAIAAGVFQDSAVSIHLAIIHEMASRQDCFLKILGFIVTLLHTDSRHFDEVFQQTWHLMLPPEKLNGRPEDVLHSIQLLLAKEGASIADFIAVPSEQLASLLSKLPDIDIRSFFIHNIQTMECSQEQLNVIETIEHSRNISYYVNGCAGSGKTHTIVQLVRRLFAKGARVLCSAYTGLAASLLPSGFTCHRLFGLPIDEGESTPSNIVSSITPQSLSGRLLQHADVIIIDEVSMLHKDFLVAINNVLQSVSNNTRPFGGKQMILCGDFHQLPPIVKGARVSMPSKTISASIASTTLFTSLRVLELKTAHRFTNQIWATFLKTVARGHGSLVPDGDPGATSLCLDERCKPNIISGSDVLNNLKAKFPLPSPLQLIAPHHKTVDLINDKQLHQYFVDEDIVSYPAFYTFAPNIGLQAQEVQLASVPNIPPNVLHLAIGAPVMILRNVNVPMGIANGAIGTVVRLDINSIDIELASNKSHVTLPRICFTIKVGGSNECIRHQFPVTLAFACTINKVQGKTTEVMFIDLQHQCFLHGQLYVALSRIRSHENLTLILPPDSLPVNIVYEDIIRFVS